ncbi:arginine--tRNA ligase [Mycoplasma mycoides]|uniref:arginine--tRNA ligase n=1 Tax=Mycoplasma mycoides TaxID=2102 RepID=UPI002240473B|nr:arginine--tRNA ligase [Mycoplasma mycoides]QVK02513.1 arginine--tRNA ligase [Mycoplasma mycoides subsp. capri]QVK05702.1 arginine--tRNA ligase [Mycoplasma mycoides subsp. capri]QVK08217.1 arginine--tRNA ligase [Mycoplasma mycoides subsp. capri]QVK09650.1 arginine--tRNA ligase [Mycoplasma mycoides subsp. capri]
MSTTIIEMFYNDLKNICQKLNITKEPIIEINKNNTPGLLSSSICLISSKQVNKKPLELAEIFKQELLLTNSYLNIDIAAPGFLNVLVKPEILSNVISNVLSLKSKYGNLEKQNKTINIEYVSANPTGYLHVGHARNAVIGSVLVNLFKKAGYNVQTEYYVNDAGNQINVLAVTVFVHYLQALNIDAKKPENCYAGDMYDDLAKIIINKYNDQFKDIKYTDNKILDDNVHSLFKQISIDYFLKIIKQQLADFNVEIKHWSSEQEVYDTHQIEKVLKLYESKDALYYKDDALFLKTTQFGDDKDRVLVKSDKTYTYILPDLATHNLRIKRTKADKLINVWGGDHHGYIKRMQAGLALLGNDPDILEIQMVQMVRLIKDGSEYKMSKRKGTAVWLVDILELVGVDALRYMLASKSSNSHMDLDLDLITLKNSSNPVYYAQYATARCHSILNQAKTKKITPLIKQTNLLNNPKEIELLLILDNFKEVIKNSANNRSTQQICDYIQNICKIFHSYYAEIKIIDENDLQLSKLRLGFIKAILQVLKNAFFIIGIQPVVEM